MNWKECARYEDSNGYRSRFEWPVGEGKSGFDCNEAFTISDIWGAISWVWTWPGDYLLSLSGVRSFFEISEVTQIGNGWSYAFPFLAYFGLLIFLALIVGLARD